MDLAQLIVGMLILPRMLPIYNALGVGDGALLSGLCACVPTVV